jgi:hypothetical protein
MCDENTASIQIYLTPSQKKLFKKACKDRQSTMAHELRRFIRAYINTPFQDDRVYYAPVKTSFNL